MKIIFRKGTNGLPRVNNRGETTLYLRYTFKSISTDFKICSVKADRLDLIERSGKLELSSTYFKPSTKDRLSNTKEIEATFSQVKDAVAALKEKSIEPRHDLVKKEVEDRANRVTSDYINNDNKSFLDVFDSCVSSKLNLGQIGKDTGRQYKATRTMIEAFEAYRYLTINTNDWNLELYDEFVHYLTEIHEGISEKSTIGKHIKIVKAVLSWTESRGMNVNPAYRSREFKVPKSKKKVFHLEEKEVEALYKYDFTDNLKLERVRDVFVLNCYIGLRISDLIRLGRKNIFPRNVDGKAIECVRIETKKGGKGDNAFVPLKERPKQIFKKYNYNLPKISDQKYNDYIKEALEEAEINRLVEVKPGQVEPLHKIVTSHIAVKTFITMCMKKGLPIKMVATITNKSVKTINEHYYSVDEDEIVRRMLF